MIKYTICNRDEIDKVIIFINNIDKDFPIPVSEKVDIEKYVKKLIENGCIFIAKYDEKIIGLCAGYINDLQNYKAYISILGVDSNFRKMGIAKELVAQFIKEACNNNMKKLLLETHKENISALKFYKKNDFIILDNCNANIKENVVLMKIIENRGK